MAKVEVEKLINYERKMICFEAAASSCELIRGKLDELGEEEEELGGVVSGDMDRAFGTIIHISAHFSDTPELTELRK